ncbi:MAG: glucose-6-phosphate isomerase family protein [Candidatus Micrarchaeia archaeon]
MEELKFDLDALLFGKDRVEPRTRTMGAMLPVVAEPDKMPEGMEDEVTYYMYREVDRIGNIRYDITRILSLDLCTERNKTFGHVHPPSKTGTPWSEVYEVLSGEAHFLLQKIIPSGVEDALLLSAKKGDCLLVPPGYGHVTINAGKGDLLMANLVSDGFEADYSIYAQRRGACFYEMLDGKLVKNEMHYGSQFGLREMASAKFSSQFGCFEPFKKGNLLEVAKNPKAIEFLEKPEMFC